MQRKRDEDSLWESLFGSINSASKDDSFDETLIAHDKALHMAKTMSDEDRELLQYTAADVRSELISNAAKLEEMDNKETGQLVVKLSKKHYRKHSRKGDKNNERVDKRGH